MGVRGVERASQPTEPPKKFHKKVHRVPNGSGTNTAKVGDTHTETHAHTDRHANPHTHSDTRP